MFRMFLVSTCLCLSFTVQGQEFMADGELELELVEWSASHFTPTYTDFFELAGEWIEYVAEDGTLRFAATGDGPHGVDVFQIDDVESIDVPVGTEVYWALDDDGEVTDLTVAYGSPVDEWMVIIDPWVGTPVTHVSSWSESVCSKRVGETKVWNCNKKSNKSCMVKIKTSGSGSQTRKGKCDGNHKITYNETSATLTFSN